MNINQTVHNSKIVSQYNNARLNQEGSKVAVRILSDLGNNRYKAWVGGLRVTIRSEKSLEPGTMMKAIMHNKNGRLSIELIKENAVQEFKAQILENEFDNIFSSVKNVELSALLKSFGIYLDVSNK